MIRKDAPIWHFHYQPTFDAVQTPKIIMPAEEIVTALSKLLLLDTAHGIGHRQHVVSEQKESVVCRKKDSETRSDQVFISKSSRYRLVRGHDLPPRATNSLIVSNDPLGSVVG